MRLCGQRWANIAVRTSFMASWRHHEVVRTEVCEHPHKASWRHHQVVRKEVGEHSCANILYGIMMSSRGCANRGVRKEVCEHSCVPIWHRKRRHQEVVWTEVCEQRCANIVMRTEVYEQRCANISVNMAPEVTSSQGCANRGVRAEPSEHSCEYSTATDIITSLPPHMGTEVTHEKLRSANRGVLT